MTEPRILPGCEVLPPMNPPKPARTQSNNAARPKRTNVTAGRFAVINTFVDCSMAKLSRSEALTWFVLWRDTKNETVRTSAADIARRIGCSRRAVTDALSKLRKRGLLTLIHRGGMNRGVSVHRVQQLEKPP